MESVIDSLKKQVFNFNTKYGEEVLVVNDSDKKPSLSVVLKDVDFRVRLDFKSDISKKVSIYNCKYNVILMDAPGLFNKFIINIESDKGFIELIDVLRRITKRSSNTSSDPSGDGSDN